MTAKPSTDIAFTTRTTERQLVTAVWRNGGCSASYDSFVVGSSAVLRLNFCAENPPLRQAANRSPDIAFGSSGERTEDYILHSTPRLTATS